MRVGLKWVANLLFRLEILLFLHLSFSNCIALLVQIHLQLRNLRRIEEKTDHGHAIDTRAGSLSGIVSEFSLMPMPIPTPWSACFLNSAPRAKGRFDLRTFELADSLVRRRRHPIGYSRMESALSSYTQFDSSSKIAVLTYVHGNPKIR